MQYYGPLAKANTYNETGTFPYKVYYICLFILFSLFLFCLGDTLCYHIGN